MGLFGPTSADVRNAYERGLRDGERRIWRRWLSSLYRDPHIPFDAPDDIAAEARAEAEAKRAAGKA